MQFVNYAAHHMNTCTFVRCVGHMSVMTVSIMMISACRVSRQNVRYVVIFYHRVHVIGAGAWSVKTMV